MHALGAAVPAELVARVLDWAKEALPPACAVAAIPGSTQQLCRSQFATVVGLAAKNPSGTSSQRHDCHRAGRRSSSSV